MFSGAKDRGTAVSYQAGLSRQCASIDIPRSKEDGDQPDDKQTRREQDFLLSATTLYPPAQAPHKEQQDNGVDKEAEILYQLPQPIKLGWVLQEQENKTAVEKDQEENADGKVEPGETRPSDLPALYQACRTPQSDQPGKDHENQQEIHSLTGRLDQEVVESLLERQVRQPEGKEKKGVDQDYNGHLVSPNKAG